MENIKKLRTWLKQQEYDGIILSRRDNYAWLTAGRENHVLESTDIGVAPLIITSDRTDIFADSSDAARIADEQNFSGGNVIMVPWYVSMEQALTGGAAGQRIVSDTGIGNTPNVQPELVSLRMQLSKDELEEYRILGQQCARLVESVCRSAIPGQTEMELAAGLKYLCLEQGIHPDCVLVGSDERIIKYRHSMPTEKKLENSLMIVLGAQRSGLNISLTRMVYFQKVPKDIREKYRKVQQIFAAMQTGMKAGTAYHEYFAFVRRLFEAAGYPEEWKFHHQGGPTGYACREFTVSPQSSGEIRLNQAYAWNPTISGVKCEETTFLSRDGIETFTGTDNWPRRVIATADGNFETAQILEKKGE